jgi:predicted GNAT superfamily acetyltransferase
MKDEFLHMRDTKSIKSYLKAYYGKVSQGVNECVETDRLLREELEKHGLENLSPRDLVPLIKCLMNDKERKK